MILTVFGDKGLLTLYRMAKERDGIVAEDRRLEEENNTLRIGIGRLETDRRYIASIARQELGMIGKDEIIYIFEE
jgi:cell division protein FtsB